MKLLITKNYDEMSKKAADLVLSLVKEKQNAVLGLATGSTPIGLYKELIEDHKNNGTSHSDIQTFNLDEYHGLEGTHDQSYRYFMDQQLFKHIDIPKEQTHVPRGNVEDIEAECQHFEELVKKSGGVDLQILGIGNNGHIGFNEPGTPFSKRTHVITLDESTREANSRFFDSIDDVPTHAVTMGIETILESKQIILLASGKSKAEPIKRLFTEEVSVDFPASALKNHENVVVIVDEEAASELDSELVEKYQG